MAGPEGKGRMNAVRPDRRRCLICGRELAWPSFYFDRVECVETWIQRHREEGTGLAGPGPGDQARGRRRGRA